MSVGCEEAGRGGQIGANPREDCVGLRKEFIFIPDGRGTPELF